MNDRTIGKGRLRVLAAVAAGWAVLVFLLGGGPALIDACVGGAGSDGCAGDSPSPAVVGQASGVPVSPAPSPSDASAPTVAPTVMPTVPPTPTPPPEYT